MSFVTQKELDDAKRRRFTDTKYEWRNEEVVACKFCGIAIWFKDRKIPVSWNTGKVHSHKRKE